MFLVPFRFPIVIGTKLLHIVLYVWMYTTMISWEVKWMFQESEHPRQSHNENIGNVYQCTNKSNRRAKNDSAWIIPIICENTSKSKTHLYTQRQAFTIFTWKIDYSQLQGYKKKKNKNDCYQGLQRSAQPQLLAMYKQQNFRFQHDVVRDLFNDNAYFLECKWFSSGGNLYF